MNTAPIVNGNGTSRDALKAERMVQIVVDTLRDGGIINRAMAEDIVKALANLNVEND